MRFSKGILCAVFAVLMKAVSTVPLCFRYDRKGEGEVSYDDVIGRVCSSTGAGGFGQTAIKTTPWDTM